MTDFTNKQRATLAELLAEAPPSMTLSQVAQAVGDGASPAQIEAFILRLEGAGVSITEPEPIDHQARLRQVLVAARALGSTGKSATASDIATHLGVPEHEVRAALLYARTLNS